MNDFPLIFFTVFVQCGIGMVLFATAHILCPKSTDASCSINAVYVSANATPDSPCIIPKLWRGAAIISGIGLVASFMHLGVPMAAPSALKSIGTSWLSNEVLFASAFLALTIVASLMVGKCDTRKMRPIAMLASLAGILTVIAQGIVYAPEAMPAIANAFPLALFVLSTVVMGSGIMAARLKAECHSVHGSYHIALWCLVVLLLIVPCVWTSGSEVMQQTAMSWGSSPVFWLGMIALIVAPILVCAKKMTLSLTLALLGIMLTRYVFFANTVHVGSMLGLPQ